MTVPPHLVATFTRQLSIMLGTGIPILQALDTLSHQHECPNFGVVVSGLADRLSKGRSLSASVREFPRVFPLLFGTMVEVGETSGQITSSLNRLADWLEGDYRFYRKVKAAIVYPMFVVTVSALLTLALFYSVLPQFVDIFVSMGIQLPALTRVMIVLTNLVRNPGAWLLAGVAAVTGLGALRRAWSTERGACRIYRLLLRLPLLGRLLSYSALARFASATEVCLDTGLDLVRTLQLGALASGSPLLAADARNLVHSIKMGQQISEHMASRREVYPGALIHLIRAGEEAANVGSTLGRASLFYEEEVGHLVETLSSMLEPILLFGVAVVVGTVLLSIFLPMYSYLGQL